MRLNFRLTVASAVLALAPLTLHAHCDGWDGPVVQAGRKAIETGDVRPALAWVRPADEAEVRGAFERVLTVRKQSPEARELADTYFYETLVRVHRVGENASFTGLKPAGRDLGPLIPAADKGIAEGSIEPLLRLVSGDLERGIRERFERVLQARRLMNGDVATGRSYVAAYVEFLHYVEALHEASAAPTGHAHEER